MYSLFIESSDTSSDSDVAARSAAVYLVNKTVRKT